MKLADKVELLRQGKSVNIYSNYMIDVFDYGKKVCAKISYFCYSIGVDKTTTSTVTAEKTDNGIVFDESGYFIKSFMLLAKIKDTLRLYLGGENAESMEEEQRFGFTKEEPEPEPEPAPIPIVDEKQEDEPKKQPLSIDIKLGKTIIATLIIRGTASEIME